jgi:hypothetical protein
MLTTAETMKGFEEKCGAASDKGVEHGVHRNARRGWSDGRKNRPL